MKQIPILSENDFKFFQEYLVKEAGLHFKKDRTDFLRLALWERMMKRKYASYQEYYHLLKFHPEGRRELRELLDLITIGETSFFRNIPQFDALMENVLPEITQKKMYSPEKSIRIWSAGCSKGDEPYSVAIAIMELLPSYKEWDISILGTDVNRISLQSARDGVYNKKDIRHLPQEYLDKYFEQSGKDYILHEDVKKLVRFEYHNLAQDPYTLDGMLNLDIIFCRNVTIYFDIHTTKRLINNFHDCLATHGYFFIGHSETLWQLTDKFKTVEFPHAFIYQKALYHVGEQEMKPFLGVPDINLEKFLPLDTEESIWDLPKKEVVIEERPVLEQPLVLPTPKEPEKKVVEVVEKGSDKNIPELYKDATKLFEEKKYEEALLKFDAILADDKRHVRAYFAKATILANQAKYEDASALLSKIMDVDNLYVEAYYLLGVLSYKMDDLEKAEDQFRKVIYIDPSIILAYFNLGNIYLYWKKFDKAIREINNTVRLLEKKNENEAIRFCEDLNVEYLLNTCRNNLEEIEELSGAI